MSNRITAFDSSLHRDVRDILAFAALVAFISVLLVVCP